MLNKNKNTKRLVFGIGVFVLFVLSAFFIGRGLFGGLDQKENSINDNTAEEAKTSLAQPDNSPHFSAELYPVMIMIDNSPEARPFHSGLSSAAVIYETLVEGGATRLALVFAGAPKNKRIGPIRSARPVFVDVASGWGAFYWHAGGSPEALAQIKNSPITDLNEISGLGTRYFWRDRTIARPHNLFSDAEKIKLGLTDFAPKFQESANIWQWGVVPEQASSSPATTIAIDFSQGILFDVGYTYDSDKKNYARIMSGRPHVDRETSQQIAVDNVIVQRVGAEEYYPSGYGRLIINAIGEGEALFFRDGRAFSGRWRKSDRSAQTEWLDEFGKQFILKPGTVLVEILPGNREVSYK